MVFVGSREHLLSLDPAVQSLAHEFLMDSWQPEEALVRLSLALSQPGGARTRPRTHTIDGSTERASRG